MVLNFYFTMICLSGKHYLFLRSWGNTERLISAWKCLFLTYNRDSSLKVFSENILKAYEGFRW